MKNGYYCSECGHGLKQGERCPEDPTAPVSYGRVLEQADLDAVPDSYPALHNMPRSERRAWLAERNLLDEDD